MIWHSLIGTVTAFTGRYFTVTSPNAPAHLQILYILPRQIGAAKVGDRVRLEYQTNAQSGLWNVAEVLPPNSDAAVTMKRGGNLTGKSVLNKLARDPRVFEITYSGGVYTLVLHPGWTCDPLGAHAAVEDTARALIIAARRISPCHCRECVANMAPNSEAADTLQRGGWRAVKFLGYTIRYVQSLDRFRIDGITNLFYSRAAAQEFILENKR